MKYVVSLLSLIAIPVRARDSCDDFTEYLCGDICISTSLPCQCGGQTIPGYWKDQHHYCCVLPPPPPPAPGGLKTSTASHCSHSEGKAGLCPGGEKKRLEESCHGRCFNEYQTYSLNQTGRLGERSRFRCDDGECVESLNICVLGWALCRDKSDLRHCSPSLHCVYYDGTGHSRPSLRSPYQHTECQYAIKENNGVFDNIGRGDEKSLTLVQSSPVIYSELQHCNNTEFGQPGLTCGDFCELDFYWCREDVTRDCHTNRTQFTINNAGLCGNTTFWSGLSCSIYYSGTAVVLTYGKRCSGARQHCHYPWYTWNYRQLDQRPQLENLLSRCQDHSDQIFEMNSPCSGSLYTRQYCDTICNQSNKHRFCVEDICLNPTGWIADQTDPYILDPHNCQDSCETPGPGCSACSNPDYFNCTTSGVCIHPSLLCDGHKHCQHGEDEDFDRCYPTYIENKVIREYGTMKCPHIMYPDIYTVAVVCDGVTECFDSTDEPKLCTNSDITVYILLAIVMILFIFVACYLFEKWVIHTHCIRKSENLRNLSRTSIFPVKCIFSDLQIYSDFHKSEVFSKKLNILLAEVKYSKNKVKRKEVCNEIISHEKTFHGHNENEIVQCFHSNLELQTFEVIMREFKPGIIDRKLPTLRRFIDKLESIQLLTMFLNVLRLLFLMLEIFKDLLLTVTIVAMVGGPLAILAFPGEFTSTITICLILTILVPVVFSTLGLAMEIPEVILNPYNIRVGKYTRRAIQAFVLIISFMNPVFLLRKGLDE